MLRRRISDQSRGWHQLQMILPIPVDRRVFERNGFPREIVDGELDRLVEMKTMLCRDQGVATQCASSGVGIATGMHVRVDTILFLLLREKRNTTEEYRSKGMSSGQVTDPIL